MEEKDLSETDMNKATLRWKATEQHLQKKNSGSNIRSETLLSLQETEAKGMLLAFIPLADALTYMPSELGRCSDRKYWNKMSQPFQLWLKPYTYKPKKLVWEV